MSNETTILRFDFGERQQEVRADQLAEIANQIQQVFTESVATTSPARVELFHALAPRRGSIEFHFRPQINIQVNTSLTTPPAATDRLNKLVAAAAVIAAGTSVASLLWTAVYGQNGMLHGALSAEPQESPNAAHEILPDLQRAPSIPRLIDACMETGADRIEIQLPDNVPVVIFDTGGRRVRGLIGRNNRMMAPIVRQGGVRSVRAESGRPIHVQYGNRVYPAFLAHIVENDGPPIKAVVVWGSNTPPTPDIDILAKLESIQADELTPMEPVPAAFEEVHAAFFLASVADWK